MNESAAKIKMMQASLRCLAFGILGLLPGIGLPFAIAALWSSGRARWIEKRLWNPARPQRLIGVVLAGLGTIGWFLVGALIVFQAVTSQQ